MNDEVTESSDETTDLVSDNLLDLDELEGFFSQLNTESDLLYQQREVSHEAYKSNFKKQFDKIKNMTEAI